MNINDREFAKFVQLPDGSWAIRISQGTAQSGVPSEASDGDAVALWVDQYGRIVIKGYNFSQDALNVVEQAPAEMQTLEFIDDPLLDAVTATGHSFEVDASQYNRANFQIVASSVSSGATIQIQASHDGTNWAVLSDNVISADGITDIQLSGKWKNLRAACTSYTDGTYTCTLVLGR